MAGELTTVVLALGSNLGDRKASLCRALQLLDERGVRVLLVSEAWETPPIPADQPLFLNAAMTGETRLPADGLLALAKEIEREMGRRPGRRWGPRPIDIDILFYGSQTISTATLEVPHPRIRERAFVLAPLGDIWEGPLPVLDEAPDVLLVRTDCSGLRRAGPLTWR